MVGGGPAGLLVALALAQKGFPVELFEGRSFPRDKPCGEGVMPHGLELLEQLGVRRQVERYRPFDGIAYRAGGTVARGHFREGVGWGIRRMELSRALTQAVARWPSIRLHSQALVRRFRRCHQGFEVWAEDRWWRGDFLVGADGLNSQVARWAGLARPPCRTRPRWGIRCHFEVPPWSRQVEVHLSPGAEAYVTPVDEGLTGVAILWEKKLSPPGGSRLWSSLLNRFPALEEKVGGLPAVEPPLAVGPLRREVRSVACHRLALVGDASGYLDALTGEGISLAAAQALSLARCLSQGEPDRYRDHHRRLGLAYKVSTTALLELVRYPRLAASVVRALRFEPDLFGRFLEVAAGRAHPGLLVAPTTLRFLLHLGKVFVTERILYGNPTANSFE